MEICAFLYIQIIPYMYVHIYIIKLSLKYAMEKGKYAKSVENVKSKKSNKKKSNSFNI